jgi:hypothetical protein
MKKIISLLCLVPLLWSCDKDRDPVVDLTVAQTNVELVEGASATLAITLGNGGYKITSSAPNVATATINGNAISITAITHGESTLLLTDKQEKSVSIRVTVTAIALTNPTSRFVWGTTEIPLLQPNGWKITTAPAYVGLVELASKTSYQLVWDGGYSAGKKTNAKLIIVSNGGAEQEVSLTSLEVVVKDDKYFVLFQNGSSKGELVDDFGN